jgi:hypothetical protein
MGITSTTRFFVARTWASITGLLGSVTDGIRNVRLWLPVVWGDRDFDHHYLFKILHFKLGRMEEFFSSGRTVCSGAKIHARQIRVARILAGRIIADDYVPNAFMHHDRKWGDLRMWGEPYDEDGTCRMAFHRPNANTREEVAQEDREYRALMNNPERQRKQDVQYLCRILEKHSHTWWD